ncbi:HET-domain-containing protein [Daldinia sp. FL1419]|nr:HET-domain-containing protein [Daldinia sp. FL1419]
MARCETCANLTVEELRSHMTFFHANLRSLRDSASAGCDLCLLCWISIQRKNPKDEIDSVLDGKFPPRHENAGQPLGDERVWLTGMFSDRFRNLGPKTASGAGTAGVDRGQGQTGSVVWVECGNEEDAETSLNKQILSSELIAFADTGTPAASSFVERNFTAFRNKGDEVDFARALLNGCRRNHPECRVTEDNSPPEMPTRVLDIGESPGWTRLVQTQHLGLREPYLALSYCWGPNVRHTVELTDQNFTTFLELIDESILTKTHQECIAIARQLGIRYVWIDSLCIIQGNLEDWIYESERMAEVYGNAALTIIAGRAADSRTGFRVNYIEEIVPPCPIPFGKDLGSVYLWLPREKAEGPVSTRGWCFQEKILSRRIFVYAAQQIYFSCQRSQLWEDGTLNMRDPTQLQIGSFPTPSEDDTVNAHPSELQRQRIQMLHLWYKEILPDYTIRHLTNPDDIFAACSSIVQLARKTIRSRYLAGIWEADMIRGLLWCAAYSVKWILKKRSWPKPKRPTDRDGETAVRAPSWSWASIQGQIYIRPEYLRLDKSFRDPSNVLIRPLFPPSTPDSTPRWTFLPDPECDANILFMRVCELAFFGRPKRVRCTNPSPPELATFPTTGWPQRRRQLAEQGFVALLKPAEKECGALEELGLPLAEAFAVVGFDIAEDRAEVGEGWFLPVLKDRGEGLLLRRDGEHGKFRRLGLVALMKKQYLPWIMSGPEEEVHLI